MIRIFGVAERDGTTLVHDPATGLTHQPSQELPPGRHHLDDAEVGRWPIIHSSVCDGAVPVSVCWSPVTRCDLVCPHCLDDEHVTELGAAERRRIARLIGAAGVLGVDIFGGEPLLLGDLTDLADELTSAGCVVSITTNGWQLDRRAARLAGHVDAVKVSLDGSTAPIHDALRGKGAFKRAVAGIKAAVAAGLHVQVQSVLTASTRAHAQDLVRLAYRLGAGGVTFLQQPALGEAVHLARREVLSEQEAHAAVEALKVPAGFSASLRTRKEAGGFTVIRANGHMWRNHRTIGHLETLQPLRTPADLTLSGPDGSA